MNEQLDTIVASLAGYWKFPPSQDEIAALQAETTGWRNLDDLVAAVEYAKRNFTDRPSVAWLLSDARRRHVNRQQEQERQQTGGVATVCPVCLGQEWIEINADNIDEQSTDMRIAHRDAIENGYGPFLHPCPRCKAVTADLHTVGAYNLDAPDTRHPRYTGILAKHGIEPRR